MVRIGHFLLDIETTDKLEFTAWFEVIQLSVPEEYVFENLW